MWERWHASNDNCPVDLFFPTNCKSFAQQAPSGVILNTVPPVALTQDLLGLFAGARLELPVHYFFLAVDGEISGMADVSGTVPGSVLALRVALAIGFRDSRRAAERRPDDRRGITGATSDRAKWASMILERIMLAH